ncbi:MAG: SPFH/Band 7/PHB domain protein [Coriobacteriia bacterium]|nr:SPFH/Band 7/PHB domain protein [Coriobacteriia bacterium]MBS5477209.1 SPFH/Band 7/PHB domain protein [Coriobacteriia bacterium]
MFESLDINFAGVIAIIVAAVIVLWLLSTCIKMVQQTDALIIEFLGSYRATWKAGLHFKLPFVERIVRRVSLKENVVDFEPQSVITRDNVTVQIDTVVFYQVTDPKRYAYGVNNPLAAIENLTATTLRNVIGDLELDQTLTSRESINSRMSIALDEATDAWGIKVNRVELKDITPPQSIRQAMEKQMKAERERRAAILQAEGEKQSQILEAEGNKQSTVLHAEAEKQAKILAAEAEKQAQILAAQGEAEAILSVQKATAQGIEMIREAGADSAVLTLKSLETMQRVADGQATKIIIPSELQGLAGLATTAGELFKATDDPAGSK